MTLPRPVTGTPMSTSGVALKATEIIDSYADAIEALQSQTPGVVGGARHWIVPRGGCLDLDTIVGV